MPELLPSYKLLGQDKLGSSLLVRKHFAKKLTSKDFDSLGVIQPFLLSSSAKKLMGRRLTIGKNRRVVYERHTPMLSAKIVPQQTLKCLPAAKKMVTLLAG